MKPVGTVFAPAKSVREPGQETPQAKTPSPQGITPSPAPKVRDTLAQGTALGPDPPRTKGLKGRDKTERLEEDEPPLPPGMAGSGFVSRRARMIAPRRLGTPPRRDVAKRNRDGEGQGWGKRVRETW